MLTKFLGLCALVFGVQLTFLLGLSIIHYILTRKQNLDEEPVLHRKQYNLCKNCGWNCNPNDILALNRFKFVFEPCPKCGYKLQTVIGHRNKDGTINIHR